MARFTAVRAPRGVRTPAALGALCMIAVASLAPPAARAEGVRADEPQALVVLLRDHVVRSGPHVDAHRMEVVAARRPLTHVRTVLPLTRATATGGQPWLRVRLPGRPSGHTGWIAAGDTRRASTRWDIGVDLSARRVTVRYAGHVARRFTAIVGKPSTPTPQGSFFVEEGLALGAGAAGGPFALATSARSRVLQEFDGGPGQIALHGMGGLSGTPGTAVSHGCIRLGTRAISWLAARIGAGVPLRVTR
ncbi:MAG TPA: L,D-transpeptidase [Baekduia sp.]|nr:L,D-transpeptidase [Baekduia sp.]